MFNAEFIIINHYLLCKKDLGQNDILMICQFSFFLVRNNLILVSTAVYKSVI